MTLLTHTVRCLKFNSIRSTRPCLASLSRHTRRSLTQNSDRNGTARTVTNVEKILLGNIKATGPLPFATYMQMCLSHPTDGYYMNQAHHVFGSKGDFITSPEISQVFGELVAVWLLSQWASTARQSPFRLVELGPGRGTLMDDILRVILQLAKPGQQINVHLVETSPSMRVLQEAKLKTPERGNVHLHWHNSISEIPTDTNEYTMLIAHEFFDALPIHVLQKTEKGWNEVLVAPNSEHKQSSPDPESSNKPDTPTMTEPDVSFRRVLSPEPSAISTVLGHSSPRFQTLPNGSYLEVSPTVFRIGRKVGELLASNTSEDGTTASPGGCGLIVDYGNDKAFGDSFRAFKNHNIVDVFHEPGNCDLTANVDFAYLKESMSDLVNCYGPLSQKAFLERMGIQLRLQSLMKSATTDARREQIAEGAKRLVDPLGMGKEYQVLAITNKLAKGAQVWPFVDMGAEEQPEGKENDSVSTQNAQ
ncbi:S-adenosyl-L-methionine-dependent methyltransferase [Panaeolus papilionaceus]|nr:S-adenosyl-L-methionine-dependent methyltransferase [Panaeolus papilionaceus]